MAVTPRLLGNVDGKSNSVTMSLPVASAVTVTAGDFVYFASGRITSATVAGARLIGQVQATATGNSGGTVKALVVVDPAAKYLVDADQDSATTTVADVGRYIDLVGATGAQFLDSSSVSSTTGQMLILEVNPQISPVASDVSFCVVKIAEHAFSPLGS